MQASKAPKRPHIPEEEELKRAKQANPNHKTTREPNQDDFKTVLDPQGRPAQVRAPPLGAIWEAKSAPKRNQKRSKTETEIQESKKPMQVDLGLVLGRSWAVWGPSWADPILKIVLSPSVALVF